ncbi:MAG TPA: ferritin-like domain-containing protein [Gemmatimonadaceae bacterium]
MIQATRVAPLYARHSAAADRGRWSLTTDIRWGDIDVQRARRQPEVLRAVRSAARQLSAQTAAVARMLQAVIRDVHACAVLTLDLHDGLKHFHALRTYLDTVEFTPALSDEELADARAATTEPALQLEDSTSALVACLLTQHMASAHLRHLCARTEEPVLAELLSFIAADEVRHARIVSDLIGLHVASNPDAGARALRRADLLRDAANRDSSLHGWARDDVALQGFLHHVEVLCGGTSPAAAIPRAALSP